jgi:hypothetical protein
MSKTTSTLTWTSHSNEILLLILYDIIDKLSFSVYDTFYKVIINNPLDVESIENQLVHLLIYRVLDLLEQE